MNAYRQVLAEPGVLRLFVSVVTVRITSSVLSLALLLTAHAATGSYASASLVLAGYAISLALMAPVLGRLCDRGRPAAILLVSLVVHVLGYLALLSSIRFDAPAPVMVGAAAVVGGTMPPASAVVRGLWARMVPEGQRHSMYALDAVSNEATFISGPLVVAAVASVADATMLIVAAGITTVVGVLAVSSTPELRMGSAQGPVPGGGAARRSWGPLIVPRVRLLLGIAAAGTFSLGTMQVGAAGSATRWGDSASSGLVLSALSVGAVAGGLVYGSRPWRGSARGQLTALYAVGGTVLLLAAAAPNLVLLGVVFALTGMASGARESIEQLLLGEAGSEDQRTETFAWLTTFMWGGFAFGGATAGQLATYAGMSAPYVAGTAACLVGAALAAAVRSRERERRRKPAGL